MNRQRVAQIYVRSEDENIELDQVTNSTSAEERFNNLPQNHHTASTSTRERFNSLEEEFPTSRYDHRGSTSTSEMFNSIDRELNKSKESMSEPKEELSDSHSDFTYHSMAHYYRVQLSKDVCSCRSVPSVLLEIIASAISIVNIALAFVAFHSISEEATGLKYTDYVGNDEAIYHGESKTSYGDEVNQATLYIYQETVFINWKNFAYLGLSLIIIELLAPLLRVVVLTKKAPKKINTLHSLVQIGLLTAIVLEDGAVSLCKNMLFADECVIRPAMMSAISQISCTTCFVNSIFKSVLFIWRSSYRTTRQVRDEMEAYTEILILEEYQWYHCIIPILIHLIVICITIWSLVDATNPYLLCTDN